MPLNFLFKYNNFILTTESDETSNAAVDGLKQIIGVKGHVVLPFIVPKVRS